MTYIMCICIYQANIRYLFFSGAYKTVMKLSVIRPQWSAFKFCY